MSNEASRIPLLPMRFTAGAVHREHTKWHGAECVSLLQCKESGKTVLTLGEEEVTFRTLAEALILLKNEYNINVIFRS